MRLAETLHLDDDLATVIMSSLGHRQHIHGAHFFFGGDITVRIAGGTSQDTHIGIDCVVEQVFLAVYLCRCCKFLLRNFVKSTAAKTRVSIGVQTRTCQETGNACSSCAII